MRSFCITPPFGKGGRGGFALPNPHASLEVGRGCPPYGHTMNIMVLGIGNLIMSDDGIGVRVVQLIAERYRLPGNVTVWLMAAPRASTFCRRSRAPTG